MEKQQNKQSNLHLVRVLQQTISAWRESGYKEGTTDTTRRLLEWWFKEEHIIKKDKFEFWKAQRQAIEALIYCYEILKTRSLYDLSQQLDVSIPLDPRTDKWPKYAFKMATGSGKTMVMAMTIVWSYFNALYEKNNKDYTKNFLLIAPNLIVLDRLLGDSKNPEFIGGAIFKKYPLIPLEWQKDFQVDVIGPNDPLVAKKKGVLFLTNWQKFVERDEKNADNPIQEMLGPKPSSEIKVSTQKLKQVLSSFDNIMVLNDEAHHVWDEKLIWNQVIEELSEKSNLISQLDFSATPRFQDGNLFPHIITEYSLGQAIDDDIVKRPKIAEIENIPEIESDRASEKYRVQIDAGVKEWRKIAKTLKPTGKKPVLFVMAEKTAAADDVAYYLKTFPELADKVLIIHTDNTGEVSKKDIEQARKWAREVDSDDNPYLAIVSVLMLREGWDVRNVKVIVPLRPLTAKAKILPEQTLGRGLRRMWPQHKNWTDDLIVIEHPQFHDLIEESLAEQGVKPEFVKIKDVFKHIEIIKVEENKKRFDIKIPISRGGLSRKMKPLEKLKAVQLPNKLFRISDLKPINIKMKTRDLRTKKIEDEKILQFPFADKPEIYISGITKAIERNARVTGQFDKLVPVVKDYIQNRLFDKKVKLNKTVLKKLNKANVRFAVLDTFVDKINEMTAVSEDLEDTGEELKASDIKPFPWSKKIVEVNKTVLNYIPAENDFEVKIAKFLDKDNNIVALIKNEQLRFRIPYINREGFLRNYIPDFIVKTKDEMGIIEAKGREDVDVKFKDNRAKEWAKQMTEIGDIEWFYLRIDQRDFERKRYKRLEDIE